MFRWAAAGKQREWRRLIVVVLATLPLVGFTAAVRAGAPASAKARRVMSMNACTDQLVMLLLPPARIASVTYLAKSAAQTPALAAEARTLKVNHGLAEEMLSEKPDLVLAGPYSTSAARRLAKQAGVPLLVADAPQTFEDIRRLTRAVADAVGEPERGEALIHRMDATLAALKATGPSRPIATVAWNGGGRIPGKGSLFYAILSAAGGEDVAAGPADFERSLDLEQLLALNPKPDLLLFASSGAGKPSLQEGLAQHPVLTRDYGGRRVITPDYECGTPASADQAAALRAEMLKALNQTRRH